MFTPTPAQQKAIEIFKDFQLKSIQDGQSPDKRSPVINHESEHFIYTIYDVHHIQIRNIIDVNPTFNELVEDCVSKKYMYQDYYDNSSRNQFVLRFSKTYQTLEFYIQKSYFARNKNNRNLGKSLIVHRKLSQFTMRPTDYVLIGGKRYISLKNFMSFPDICPELRLHLLNSHLKSNFTFEELGTKNINIPNKLSKSKSTLADILDVIIKNPVPKILKKHFTTKGLLFLYSTINENDVCKLINFYKEYAESFKPTHDHLKDYLHLPLVLSKTHETAEEDICHSFIFNYMAYKLNLSIPIKIYNQEIEKKVLVYKAKLDKDKTMLEDYIRMAFGLGQKVNINITSLKRLKYLHDQVMIQYRLQKSNIPEIKVSKVFPDIPASVSLPFRDDISYLFEKIVDRKRLIQESVIMNHCVMSYYPQINSGESCIYHIKNSESGETGTLEVKNRKKEDKNILYVNQFNGIWNTKISNDFRNHIMSILNQYHIKSSFQEISPELINEDLPF